METDFLVLGSAPFVPQRPSEDFLLTDDRDTTTYQQAQERADHYQNVRRDGAALGVPTFNLPRLLYFIGYYQQARAGN